MKDDFLEPLPFQWFCSDTSANHEEKQEDWCVVFVLDKMLFANSIHT